MPHKRKSKGGGGFCPQLDFQPENSWLYLAVHEYTEDTLQVPLHTLAVLFTLRYTSISRARVRLLLVAREEGEYSVGVCREGLPPGVHLLQEDCLEEVAREVKCCRPPVWYLPAQRTCVAGLCSVVRYLLRLAAATEGLEQCTSLLGFQQGCLSAPAEVSTWTRYCEVEAGSVLQELTEVKEIKELKEGHEAKEPTLPEHLARLEVHLGQPLRMHNVRDVMQRSGWQREGGEGGEDRGGEGEDPIAVFARENHLYLEGPELLLSDLLLYPLFHLVAAQTDLLQEGATSSLPHTTTWLARVALAGAGQVMDSLVRLREGARLARAHLSLPTVPQHSLYKSDPARDGGNKSFTRQAEVERALDWWQESGLDTKQQGETELAGLDWSALPALVQPEAGSLPKARQKRKEGQLASLALPAVALAREGDTVVDFCSGGGHLGLLLAHLLPSCTLHLVENKEESLARARARGLAMQGHNTWFFQSNLDYYRGHFEVGCSLHACGLATDLVIAKCTAQAAALVCCPCCYGGVSATEHLAYPRSPQFSSLSYPDYLSLGHAADQTEQGSFKQEQGKLCMDVVDTDRALALEALGYTASLSRLTPPDCTPKNNLLVASPHR